MPSLVRYQGIKVSARAAARRRVHAPATNSTTPPHNTLCGIHVLPSLYYIAVQTMRLPPYVPPPAYCTHCPPFAGRDAVQRAHGENCLTGAAEPRTLWALDTL